MDLSKLSRRELEAQYERLSEEFVTVARIAGEATHAYAKAVIAHQDDLDVEPRVPLNAMGPGFKIEVDLVDSPSVRRVLAVHRELAERASQQERAS